jgi:hypothetical protein
MRFSISIQIVLFGWFAISAASAVGCKEPVYNYSECVQIETARCDVRDGCTGEEEFDHSYPGFDRDTCVAYSKEHCKTRKLGGEGWDQDDVEACALSILDLSCDDLIPRGNDETEKLKDCWFIENENSDPGEDTETADSATGDLESDGETDSKDGGD